MLINIVAFNNAIHRGSTAAAAAPTVTYKGLPSDLPYRRLHLLQGQHHSHGKAAGLHPPCDPGECGRAGHGLCSASVSRCQKLKKVHTCSA